MSDIGLTNNSGFTFVVSCECNAQVVILQGKCKQHNKEWYARIDATYIQELISRVVALEKRLEDLE